MDQSTLTNQENTPTVWCNGIVQTTEDIASHNYINNTLLDCGSLVGASILKESQQFNQVIFHDLYEIYPTDSDLHCRYTLTESVKYAHGDKVGLFKVGWSSVNDCLQYILAPIPLSAKEYSTMRIVFPANVLPKDEYEVYQLCYITHESKVVGASVPFEFRRPDQSDLVDIEDKNDPGLTVYKSRVAVLHDRLSKAEEEKETFELRCHTLAEQVTIVDKELTSVTTLNKDLKSSVEKAQNMVVSLKEELYSNKEKLCISESAREQLEGEVNEYKLKLVTANNEFINEIEEKNQILLALDSVKQGSYSVLQDKVRAELMLKEVNEYNLRLRNESDDLKTKNEELIAEANILSATIKDLKSKIEELTKQGTTHNANMVLLTSPGPSSASEKDLLFQRDQALQLLEEALQNQPAIDEETLSYIALQDKVKILEELNTSQKQTISTQNLDLNSKTEMVNKLQLEIDSVKSGLGIELQETRIISEQLGNENVNLQQKLNELQRKYSCEKIEEMEELVMSLRKALISEPNFDSFYKILIESASITAKRTYKELFDIVQFLNFENPGTAVFVRRLLDEFSILHQDLERCRQELQDTIAEVEKTKLELNRVSEENEVYQCQIAQLNNIISDLNNCKESFLNKESDIKEVESLKTDIIELKSINDSLQQLQQQLNKQLKDAKVASALNSIGCTSVGRSELIEENERLRSKLKELELSQNLIPKKCCEELQERLKQSAKEYAKLYQQMIEERAYNSHKESVNNMTSSMKRISMQKSVDTNECQINSDSTHG